MTDLRSKSSTGRVLGALLAGCLVLAFWGCGGSNNTSLTPVGDASTGPEDSGSGTDGSIAQDTGGGGEDATGAQDATGGQDSGASGHDGGGGDTGTGGVDSGTGSTDSGTTSDACVSKTCGQQGFDCGSALDGCGNIILCGTCPTGQTCGLNSANVCGGVVCTPKTCAQQGFDCGAATDGCGNVIQCGSCPTNQTCGAGGNNICGGVPCTGLCQAQTTCTGTATTSITGRVYAPNGTDPLYDVLVYVPNGGPAPTYGVLPFAPGVSCGSCGSQVTGSPLVSTVTAIDGSFTITNMPVGTNIPLVIQTGRWRRQITIPSVPSCVSTALPSTLTTMPSCRTGNATCPAGKATGDIPLMGFVTGSVDSLECVLRKIGIADSEFTDPTGVGRVRFYEGNGDGLGSAGAAGGAIVSAATPTENSLWGTQAEINAYDMVYFACQGNEYDKLAANQQIVVDYTNAGGRLFTTHYSYVWLFNDAPFSTTASWAVGGASPTNDPQTGYINTSFPEGLALAQWLQNLGASTTLGQIQLATLRHDFTGVVAPSLLWMSLGADPTDPSAPMHYTFNTPVGATPASQCGKVLFNDYHVEDSETTVTTGVTFPSECTATSMTPQEKMLEFDIFDLGACVTPPVACVPKTCMQIGASCGPEGDGCGNIIQCGMCQGAQTCGGGGTPGVCGSGGTCTPKTCAQLGLNCGQTSDGCSNVINCGVCTLPLTCGGGGQSNVCGGQF